jgi:hypothetical protein
MERLMRSFRMQQIGQALPALPGLPTYEPPKTYAAWPVWRDSTTREVHFQPMPKKKAVKLWHRARAFDRQTKQEGKHGGVLGHAALQVLHTLIFDFLNYASGQLDPSQAQIARAANMCERAVRSALNRLRDFGILHWVRRCREMKQAGGFIMEQISNAYAVLTEGQWRGYRPPPEPTAPWPDTWGATPPLPSQLVQAADEVRRGGDPRTVLAMLEADPADELTATLAKLGRSMCLGIPQ